MTALEARRRLLMMAVSRLPKEYQEVEWIKSTGTQYIDTGVLFDHGIKITAKMAWTLEVTASLQAVFGTRIDSGNTRFFAISNQGRFDGAYRTDHVLSSLIVANQMNNILFDTTAPNTFAMSFNGSGFNYTVEEFVTNTTGYIFAYHRASDDSAQAKSGAIYKSMVIEDASGTKLFDGVPCYRKSDGEIGIYDLANKRFLTNIGTGTFIIPE